MMAAYFNRDFAKSVLDAIGAGKPLPVPPDQWTGNNMLTVAGILYAAVYADRLKLKKLHPERREAVEETFHQDIHSGIEFLGSLSFAVINGTYEHEPEVKFIVYEQEDGQKVVLPLQGFKGQIKEWLQPADEGEAATPL
jgi:hypothetical protein